MTAAAISALKNDLKRLVNQRAMAVASKLSGSQQDEQLRACEGKLARIEAEIAQFKAQLLKGETKLNVDSIQSEFLVLNPSATAFTIDALVGRLEGYRSSTKDKVSWKNWYINSRVLGVVFNKFHLCSYLTRFVNIACVFVRKVMFTLSLGSLWKKS